MGKREHRNGQESVLLLPASLSSTKTKLSSSRLKWVLAIYNDLNYQSVTVFLKIFKNFSKKE